MSTAELARPVKRALISVSDKAGIVEFAGALRQRGVESFQQAAPTGC